MEIFGEMFPLSSW